MIVCFICLLSIYMFTFNVCLMDITHNIQVFNSVSHLNTRPLPPLC